MENRFEKFVKKEETIGSIFANHLNSIYKKQNSLNTYGIDGQINGIDIELQELRSQSFIKQKKICIDVISVGYFRTEEHKKIITKQDILDKSFSVKKYGKIFNKDFKDDILYLIYIDGENIPKQEIEFFESNLLKIDNYYFIPLNMKKVREYFKEKEFFNIYLNNKKNLKDNWESGYSLLDLQRIIDNKLFFDLALIQNKNISNEYSNIPHP